jgi:hypothetical protein
MLVVLHAAEELPDDVLAPALADLFVAEVEAVLEVQQAGHQPDRCLGPTGVAASGPQHSARRAEQIVAFDDRASAILMLELGRQR